MKKKLLSLALALVMIVSLVPAAYADNANYWTNFRNSLYNMAVTDAATPASPETTTEKWVKKYGTGWMAAPQRLYHCRQCAGIHGRQYAEKSGSADRCAYQGSHHV